MSIKLIAAIIALFCLTPLIIGSTSMSVKMVTLLYTGLAIVHAVFYSVLHTIKKSKRVSMNVNFNWIISYLVFGLSVPMVTNMFPYADDLHMLTVAILASGLLVNNYYIINIKPMYLAVTSILYGIGTSVVVTNLLYAETIGDQKVNIILITYALLAAMLSIVSAYIVHAIAVEMKLNIE